MDQLALAKKDNTSYIRDDRLHQPRSRTRWFIFAQLPSGVFESMKDAFFALSERKGIIAH